MEIVIIGAGLGGLCAALGLARKGHQVRVLEQRASLAPVGGALNVRPGASKILHEWGLGADLERVSVNTPANVLRDWQSSRIFHGGRHGMQPSAAQGFSLTVEDIGVLVYLISTDPDPATAVPMITQNWQNIRKARCERIKAWARHNTSMFTTSSRIARPRGAETQVRSLKDVKPDMQAKFGTAAFLKWAEGTDAIEEAKRYLQNHRSRL